MKKSVFFAVVFLAVMHTVAIFAADKPAELSGLEKAAIIKKEKIAQLEHLNSVMQVKKAEVDQIDNEIYSLVGEIRSMDDLIKRGVIVGKTEDKKKDEKKT